jgi:threonine/homoserine/homoserine lactone efflux protein
MTALAFSLVFLCTACISFVGSLQAGLVNVSVVRTALVRNRRAALWLAAGGSLPELLYATLAVFIGHRLAAYPALFQRLEVAAGFVLAAAGVWYVATARRPPARLSQKTLLSFWQGFGLGMANPQLLPFWLGIFVFLNPAFALENDWLRGAFVTGAAGGAFLLLAGLAVFADRHRDKILTWFGSRAVQAAVGWLLLGLGIWKLSGIFL